MPAWRGPCCCWAVLIAAYLGVGLAQQDAGADDPRQFIHAGHERAFALTHDAPLIVRCATTSGTWCKDFHQQQPIPWKPAPRGSKTCPKDCNGVGNCQHDIGLCQCPAGTQGAACDKPLKRPCSHMARFKDEQKDEPYSHIDEDGRDLDWTVGGHNMQCRCGGVCDDDTASCYCDGPFGRINPPKGSKPGSKPVRRGRPMIESFNQPREDWKGRKTWVGRDNGGRPYDDLYGPEGWCNVSKPRIHVPCIVDGLTGPTCEDIHEHFCIGQCSGHGECDQGFCKCDPGWYGHDCSRKLAGKPMEASRLSTQNWLRDVVNYPVAALDPPPKETRLRPLIYVYDTEPFFHTTLLQYRVAKKSCTHRMFEFGNRSEWTNQWVYAVETLFHEQLLASPHRTFDPEEADFFYMPTAASCFPWPLMKWADFPYFHSSDGSPRTLQITNIFFDAKRWAESWFPYWARRRGRDHIFYFGHDEGACYAPYEMKDSIFLTHWGRMGLDHVSQTGFDADNYSVNYVDWREPAGWQAKIAGHACYDPEKDLVIPSFKDPSHYEKSPLTGSPTRKRDIFFFFRGDVGKRRPNQGYSRGIRQKIYKMWQDQGWKKKYNALIGDSADIWGDYSDHLARSKFCLVTGGDGFSARMEDAVLHGCIPVVIFDGVHFPFESVIEYDKMSVRVKEVDVPRIMEILLAIPERKVKAMQARLGRVWHRFRWSNSPNLERDLKNRLSGFGRLELTRTERPAGEANVAGAVDGKLLLPRPFKGDPTVDDAFSTIMQWLASRIPKTREEVPGVMRPGEKTWSSHP